MKIEYSSHKFVVIGAGETGRAIINFLNYHQAQILRLLDTRSEPPTGFGYPVIGGALEYAALADADVIVISPGVSIYEPALRHAQTQGKLVIGDIELFARASAKWGAKIIGITGSNGKTTVTSLCGFLAQSVGIKTLVAGNIGQQVLRAWLEIEASGVYPELIVLELSSFQLETTQSLALNSATVLNISEDHLDRYRDLLEYAYTKAHIFNLSQVQVLNADDPLVVAMQRHAQSPLFFAAAQDVNAAYSLNYIDSVGHLTVNGENYLALEQLQLFGRHNYLNALASLALLAGAGYELEQFKAGLCHFAGLEHRMQKVAEHAGIFYIEDSKGTNVGAVIAGVGGIERPVHLILGGDGKGQDFAPLRALVERKCRSVAIIGQDAEQIHAVLAGLPQVSICRSLPEAVHYCYAQATFGDALILSPACASWDMFSNYKQRAQVFIDTVNEIIQKNP